MEDGAANGQAVWLGIALLCGPAYLLTCRCGGWKSGKTFPVTSVSGKLVRQAWGIGDILSGQDPDMPEWNQTLSAAHVFLGVREGTSWAMRTECDCRTLGKLKTSVTMELVTILGKINWTKIKMKYLQPCMLRQVAMHLLPPRLYIFYPRGCSHSFVEVLPGFGGRWSVWIWRSFASLAGLPVAWHARAICLGCCQRAIRGNCKHQYLSPMERGWGLILLLSVIAFFFGECCSASSSLKLLSPIPKLQLLPRRPAVGRRAMKEPRNWCSTKTCKLSSNFLIPFQEQEAIATDVKTRLCPTHHNASRNETHMHSAS